MERVHLQVLEAARRVARPDGRFRLSEVVRVLPLLDAKTVCTHVASRCCVNAPANHQSRYEYFRRVGRGEYRLEPGFRKPSRMAEGEASQDRAIKLGSGVDPTLIDESLRMSPTERLETMRQAALALAAMTG